MVVPSHESTKRCPEEVRTEKTEEGDVDSGIPSGCSGDFVTPQRDARTPRDQAGERVGSSFSRWVSVDHCLPGSASLLARARSGIVPLRHTRTPGGGAIRTVFRIRILGLVPLLIIAVGVVRSGLLVLVPIAALVMGSMIMAFMREHDPRSRPQEEEETQS